MRTSLSVILLAASLSGHAAPPGIDSLAWMAGPWHGTVGELIVDEHWRLHESGTMGTMVLVSDEEGVNTVELIVINEHDDTLVLHLRQFSPALEVRVEQDMRLTELGDRTVTFAAAENARISELRYTLAGENRLEVRLTFADGSQVTAKLTRQ